MKMKVTKNPLLGTWEMAESEGPISPGPIDLRPCDTSRILIVDDEAKMRQLFRAMLQRRFPDIEYDMAADGVQAIEQFQTHQQHVVLMDMVMPVMSGEESYYQIADHCDKSGWQCPRFIFCTGHSPSVGLRNVVASDPAHCLLQKPVRQQTLVTAVMKRVHQRPSAPAS